ncbi:MAG: hypothetical protein R3C12_15340 [Planctomycetaceae bacterium]
MSFVGWFVFPNDQPFPLKRFVLEKLQLKWSPEQISGQLPCSVSSRRRSSGEGVVAVVGSHAVAVVGDGLIEPLVQVVSLPG